MNDDKELAASLHHLVEDLEPDEQVAWQRLNHRLSARGRHSISVLLRAVAAALVVVGVTLLIWMAGRHQSQPGGASAACADVVYFKGQQYEGATAVVIPTLGDTLGNARIPGCNDTGAPTNPPDEFITVASLPGVNPDVAVVSVDSPEVIYVRKGLLPTDPPLARFFVAPKCDPGAAPIRLRGMWLTIAQPDGTTELDLRPPYDLGILVSQASSDLYLNAKLTVLVPQELGTPISRQDLESSLWKGGDLQLTVNCAGGSFVATDVQTFPP